MARSQSPRPGLTPPRSPSWQSKRKRPSQSWAREPGAGPDKHKDRIREFMEARWPDQYAEYRNWGKNPDRSPVPPHAREARRKARQRARAKTKAVPIPKRAPSQKSNSPRSPSRSRSTTPYQHRVAFDDKGEVMNYSKKDKVNAAADASKGKSPSPLPPIEWNIPSVQTKDKSPRKSASRSPKKDAPSAGGAPTPTTEAPADPATGGSADPSGALAKATLLPGPKGKGKSTQTLPVPPQGVRNRRLTGFRLNADGVGGRSYPSEAKTEATSPS